MDTKLLLIETNKKENKMKNEIENKINELAKSVMSDEMFNRFKKGDSDCKVVLLATIARMSNDTKIVDMCEKLICLI